jgi:hypothetical protein
MPEKQRLEIALAREMLMSERSLAVASPPPTLSGLNQSCDAAVPGVPADGFLSPLWQEAARQHKVPPVWYSPYITNLEISGSPSSTSNCPESQELASQADVKDSNSMHILNTPTSRGFGA